MNQGLVTGVDRDLVTIERKGALASVVLDTRSSPRVMLGSAMAREHLAPAFPGFARDPDCYAVVVRHRAAGAAPAGAAEDTDPTGRAAETLDAFVAHQRFAWLLECFSKPTVHLIDGAIDGPVAALVQCATHRVGTERYAWTLPQVQAGDVLDAGIAHALARLPDHIGECLALTGLVLSAADALELGFLTHCIPAAHFAKIEKALAAAEPVDPLLDGLHVDPGTGLIGRDRRMISRCFGRPTIAAILGELTEVVHAGADGASSARVMLDALERAPPVALEVGLRHIRDAKVLDFRLTLMREARIAREAIRWSGCRGPALPGAVDRHFVHQGETALVLPTRTEMQARRV